MLNIEIIHRVLQDFHDMTGLRSILKDPYGKVLAALIKGQGHCAFCRKIYDTEKGSFACYFSDKKAFDTAIATRTPQIYTCHAGLTDIVIPLYINDQCVGAVVTGQYFTKGNKPVNYAKLEKEFGMKKDELKKAFSTVPVLDEDKVSFYVKTIYSVLNYALTIELKFLETVEDKETAYMSYKIRRAEEIIKERFTTELSMDNVAKEVGVSASHFSVMFKKYTGISFKDYLTRMRIEKAKILLETTEKSITDIAFDIGCGNSNYFSTMFSKATGISPREYRIKNQNTSPPDYKIYQL